MGLNVPSRLKGIETEHINETVYSNKSSSSLNVPSRLKGIETDFQVVIILAVFRLNVPSRLKGIETLFGKVFATPYLLV